MYNNRMQARPRQSIKWACMPLPPAKLASPATYKKNGVYWASHRLPAPPLLLLLLLAPPLRKARLLRLAQPHTW